MENEYQIRNRVRQLQYEIRIAINEQKMPNSDWDTIEKKILKLQRELRTIFI